MLKSRPVEKIQGLSLIIITFNEERDLKSCLDSVHGLVDEIVLVDSGSTDNTYEIARRFTPHVYQRKWNGYGEQKQHALEHARGPWILNLDADERLSPELAQEIRDLFTRSAAGGPEAHGFDIPYRHYFLGRRLRFGGVHGEKHIRLFRKSKAAYGTNKVHEGIVVEPPVRTLKNPIDHYSYRDVPDYLAKCDWYTTLIAKDKFQKGQRFRLWHHLRLPFEFIVRYFLKLGFLDGSAGLTYAALSSYYVWLKFLKLQDLEVKK
jgi:glycosyltransferase involved in cell wall biosynthesis